MVSRTPLNAPPTPQRMGPVAEPLLSYYLQQVCENVHPEIPLVLLFVLIEVE